MFGTSTVQPTGHRILRTFRSHKHLCSGDAIQSNKLRRGSKSTTTTTATTTSHAVPTLSVARPPTSSSSSARPSSSNRPPQPILACDPLRANPPQVTRARAASSPSAPAAAHPPAPTRTDTMASNASVRHTYDERAAYHLGASAYYAATLRQAQSLHNLRARASVGHAAPPPPRPESHALPGGRTRRRALGDLPPLHDPRSAALEIHDSFDFGFRQAPPASPIFASGSSVSSSFSTATRGSVMSNTNTSNGEDDDDYDDDSSEEPSNDGGHLFGYNRAVVGLGVGPAALVSSSSSTSSSSPQPQHLRTATTTPSPPDPLEYYRRGNWKRRGIIFDVPVKIVGEDADEEAEERGDFDITEYYA